MNKTLHLCLSTVDVAPVCPRHNWTLFMVVTIPSTDHDLKTVTDIWGV